MSEREARQIKAEAVLSLKESREHLNVCKENAQLLGKDFNGLGNLLTSNPSNISEDSYRELLNFENLVNVIADVRKAEADLLEAQQKAAAIGVDEAMSF